MTGNEMTGLEMLLQVIGQEVETYIAETERARKEQTPANFNTDDDARYLAALVDTLIDNKYLTQEFESKHPEILVEAKTAAKRVREKI